MNPVYARNIVATSQPLAAQAGLQALAKGGNAVDAALACAITLTVVEPTMNGLGGDAFALVWHEGKLHGLNASGRAPAAWTPAHFAGRKTMPDRGWGSVTVPGVVSSWVALSKRFGRLPFADLFEAAIRYARDGYAVTRVIARHWAEAVPVLKPYPGFTDSFTHAGRAPVQGEIWRYPEQAKTLESIAQTNGESFYRGDIAASIAAFARATGGDITEDDLAAHECDWVEPLGFDYKDHRLYEIPPNGQGIGAQMALGMLEHLNASQHPSLSAQRIHLQVEAMKLAFADLQAHVADPASMKTSPDALLNKDYLAKRASLIDPAKASSYPPGKLHHGGTVYLCAADQDGGMVSFIQSNFKGFGSGVVAPGGIALQNRGWGFSLEEGHPNIVAPRKRPFHTIIPAFLTKNGQPSMAYGVMGGNMQAQGHLQLAMSVVDDDLSPQEASNCPRWRINDEGRLTVEAAMPAEVVADLRAKGHDLLVMPVDSTDFGSAQAIGRVSETLADGYRSGSDHRRDGQAVGY